MVPALLETQVKFLEPLRRVASIKFSGIPLVPNPPTRMVTPSDSLAIAASALATRLSIYPAPCWKRLFPEYPVSLLQVPQNSVNFASRGKLVGQRARAKIAAKLLQSL